MTASTSEQKQLSCSEVMLLYEKTVVEDTLSPEEQTAMDSHVNQCLRCRKLVRVASDLFLFTEDTSEEALHSAATFAIIALRRNRQAELGRKWGWKKFAIAGAAAALMLLGTWNLWSSFDAPSSRSAAAQCTPSSPVEAASGVFMTYCNDDDPDVFVASNSVKVSLQRGKVALFVDPERPDKKQTTVVTPFGEVRVNGTLFTVRIDGDGVEVNVFRGLVEVIPEGGVDLTFHVAAGYGANLEQRATFKLSEPKTDALIEALRIAPSGEPAEEATVRTQEAVISSKSSGAEDEADIGAGTEDAGRAGGTKNIQHATDEGRKLSNPASMEWLIKKARSCLMRRDWECAASRYQEVLGTYSQRPESASVLISLAKIELRHLSNPNRALTHFGTYLERAPNGPLAEEAVLGTADAYRRLGLTAEERKTLSHFVERYPQSALLDKARVRLRQLDGASL